MKYLLKIFSVLSLFFLLHTGAVFAASLEYASFVSTDGVSSSFVIKYGGLEEKNNYLCSILSLSCSATNVSASSSPAFDYGAIPKSRKGVMFRGHSQDGRFIFFYQWAGAQDKYRHYVLLDTKTRETYERKSEVPFLDLMTEQDRLFSISPDDSTLFYLDDRDGSPAIYMVDLLHLKKGSMSGTKLTRRDYTVADFLAYDKDNIYFIANRSNPLTWTLYHYNISTEKLDPVASNVSYGEVIKKVGTYILVMKIRDNTVVPMIYDPVKRGISFFSLPQTLGQANISIPYQPFRYGQLTGVVSYPDRDGPKVKHPLIVWLHGGPYRQDSLTVHPYLSYGVYDWVLNEARLSGAIIFKLDYSGSYGYGSAFIAGLKENIGKKDVNDVVTALDSVKKEASKNFSISGVYLVGNSYGGYLSLRSLVAYPKRFDGAFSINGVTDWRSLLTNLGDSLFNSYFNGVPNSKNEKLYAKADILKRAGDVLPTHKVVLVQAQKDKTIDPIQAELLKTTWQKDGVNVDLVRILEEDHVFHKVASISLICRSLLGFLDIAPPSPERCRFW